MLWLLSTVLVVSGRTAIRHRQAHPWSRRHFTGVRPPFVSGNSYPKERSSKEGEKEEEKEEIRMVLDFARCMLQRNILVQAF